MAYSISHPGLCNPICMAAVRAMLLNRIDLSVQRCTVGNGQHDSRSIAWICGSLRVPVATVSQSSRISPGPISVKKSTSVRSCLAETEMIDQKRSGELS